MRKKFVLILQKEMEEGEGRRDKKENIMIEEV